MGCLAMNELWVSTFLLGLEWAGQLGSLCVAKLVRAFLMGKNIILVSTFWNYSQFDLCILIVINLVHVIFNLKPI